MILKKIILSNKSFCSFKLRSKLRSVKLQHRYSKKDVGANRFNFIKWPWQRNNWKSRQQMDKPFLYRRNMWKFLYIPCFEDESIGIYLHRSARKWVVGRTGDGSTSRWFHKHHNPWNIIWLWFTRVGTTIYQTPEEASIRQLQHSIKQHSSAFACQTNCWRDKKCTRCFLIVISALEMMKIYIFLKNTILQLF